jgi:hypothetical protein
MGIIGAGSNLDNIRAAHAERTMQLTVPLPPEGSLTVILSAVDVNGKTRSVSVNLSVESWERMTTERLMVEIIHPAVTAIRQGV